HRCAHGELKRIGKKPDVVAAQVGGAEVLERVLRCQRRRLRRQKTLPHQKHERDKGEPSNECYRHADHHPLGIEPRRSGGSRGEALDRVGHGSGPYATGSICSLCTSPTGLARAFALPGWPRTPTPNSALPMILLLRM